jgi:hypothetical protein
MDASLGLGALLESAAMLAVVTVVITLAALLLVPLAARTLPQARKVRKWPGVERLALISHTGDDDNAYMNGPMTCRTPWPSSIHLRTAAVAENESCG